MAEEKLRLGGMALANGVLVHGPESWACAIRTEDGQLKVAAQRKRQWASKVESPLLRGPARLLDAMAIIPQIRHALPGGDGCRSSAPRSSRRCSAAPSVVRVLRGSRSVGPAAQELVSGLLSIAPAALALRGADVAAYHGAEHISIGSYEQGKRAAKEHNRCGSHLIGPLLVTTAIGNIARGAGARPPPQARAARARSSWRWPLRPRSSAGWCATPRTGSRAPLRSPATSSSIDSRPRSRHAEQIEVAEAALAACLELEQE